MKKFVIKCSAKLHKGKREELFPRARATPEELAAFNQALAIFRKINFKGRRSAADFYSHLVGNFLREHGK